MQSHQPTVPAHGDHHFAPLAQLDDAAFAYELKKCTQAEGSELAPARLAGPERPSLLKRIQRLLPISLLQRRFR